MVSPHISPPHHHQLALTVRRVSGYAESLIIKNVKISQVSNQAASADGLLGVVLSVLFMGYTPTDHHRVLPTGREVGSLDTARCDPLRVYVPQNSEIASFLARVRLSV